MKIQIIPDIHNRTWLAEEQVKAENADKVIFLGDYFDNFHEPDTSAKRVAIWLKYSLKFPNRIHLLGNHDLWYFYPNIAGRPCPGNTMSKAAMIASVLNRHDAEQFKLAHFEDNVIFSHAGMNDELFAHPIHGTQQFWLEECLHRAIQTPNSLELTAASERRRGRYPMGGILWQDWGEMDFLKDWNQIVGHSSEPTVRISYLPNKKTYTHWNICFDTFNLFYGVIENQAVYSVEWKTGERKKLVDLK